MPLARLSRNARCVRHSAPRCASRACAIWCHGVPRVSASVRADVLAAAAAAADAAEDDHADHPLVAASAAPCAAAACCCCACLASIDWIQCGKA